MLVVRQMNRGNRSTQNRVGLVWSPQHSHTVQVHPGLRPELFSAKAVQVRGKYGFFVEKIKTSGSVRNQVAAGFATYRSIGRITAKS